MISVIYAKNKQNIIGKNNSLCWHYSEDLKYFKEKTLNQNIIMGRKTFESIGKPLPKRNNIVITSSKIEGVITFSDFKKAIEYCDNDCFIIGGSSLYNICFKESLVDIIYETIVPDEVEIDQSTVFINDIPNGYKLYNQSIINNLTFNIYKNEKKIISNSGND
jgi:dihydrofolate reductase